MFFFFPHGSKKRITCSQTACLHSSSCSSLGRAAARVVRRRRRRACARAGRRWSPPAGAATARRPGGTQGRTDLWRGPRVSQDRASQRPATLLRRAVEEGPGRSGRRGGAWRANAPLARGRSGMAGENQLRLLGEVGEADLVAVLPTRRPAREMRAAARGAVGR